VRLAIKEDVGKRDLTTRLLIRPTNNIKAVIQAEEAGVLCGITVAKRVFHHLDPRIKFEAFILHYERVRLP